MGGFKKSALINVEAEFERSAKQFMRATKLTMHSINVRFSQPQLSNCYV